MPFFLHFRSDFLIEPLPGTVPAGEQPKWPPITARRLSSGAAARDQAGLISLVLQRQRSPIGPACVRVRICCRSIQGKADARVDVARVVIANIGNDFAASSREVRRAESVRDQLADPVPLDRRSVAARAQDLDVAAAQLGGFEDRLAAAAARRADAVASSPPATAIRATLSSPNWCWAAVSALCSAQMPRR